MYTTEVKTIKKKIAVLPEVVAGIIGEPKSFTISETKKNYWIMVTLLGNNAENSNNKVTPS